MNTDKYLYEIIDDYKHAVSDEEKNGIFEAFCSSIWSSPNKRRVRTKKIKFSVKEDLLNTPEGQIFNMWSEVEYMGYKSICKESDWCSLIRQKINNLYTRYFDKEVILKKDYLGLLNTPKRLYYQWSRGIETAPQQLTVIIGEALESAAQLKTAYQKQKMELQWKDYKKITEGFLQKIFSNCKLIEDYEDNTQYCNMYDFINEDNFYIRFFCKSLEAYMLNYQKKYYGLYVKGSKDKNYNIKRCADCGGLFRDTSKTRPVIYCGPCRIKHRKESQKKYNRTR